MQECRLREGSRRAGATLGGAAGMVPGFPLSFRITRLGRIRVLTWKIPMALPAMNTHLEHNARMLPKFDS